MSIASTPPGRTYRVVGFAGSLRKGSYNKALLRAARDLAPPELTITIHDIDPIPMYNADVEAAGAPQPVADLRRAVTEADGVLIAMPEYNRGVPGVLKNTIDWLSRPGGKSSLNEKPVAIMGASTGVTGTARGQGHLRDSLTSTNSFTMLKPDVLMGRAQEKFDAEGNLTDEGTRMFLRGYLESFVRWIGKMGAR